MSDEARLHLELPSRLADPIRRVSGRLRLQVLLLLGVWQLANLAGFLAQAGIEMLGVDRGGVPSIPPSPIPGSRADEAGD